MVAPREISDFLRTRRDRLTPADVGYRPGGARRRVAGLRREEVAAPRRSTATEIRPPVRRVLDPITDAVAFIRNGRADFVAGNALARALNAEVIASSTRPISLPRYVFLDPRARTFYRRWSGIAEATTGSLRAEAARDPYDRGLTDLIGELSTRSDDFRRMWATNDVTLYRSGTQHFRHPVVGDLDLDYETFDLTTDIGQSLVVYSAPEGSESQIALRRLVEEE